jgi:hypothetical protein
MVPPESSLIAIVEGGVEEQASRVTELASELSDQLCLCKNQLCIFFREFFTAYFGYPVEDFPFSFASVYFVAHTRDSF